MKVINLDDRRHKAKEVLQHTDCQQPHWLLCADGRVRCAECQALAPIRWYDDHGGDVA